MRSYSTPHAHTDFVDGKATPEVMLETAYRLGCTAIGLSEHARQSVDAAEGLSLENEAAYKRRVSALRERYRGKMRVHLGIEMDAYAVCAAEDYEYVIGSVHYLPDICGACPVDLSRDALLGLRRRACRDDGDVLAELYYHAVAENILRRKPDICGHIDLLRKFNEQGAVYDENSPRASRAALDALDAARQIDAILEINTGAMSRGYATSPYPSLFLLKAWRDMGGRIILSSDAHRPEHLFYGYGAALELVRAAGFETLWTLGDEGEEMFMERRVSEYENA